MSCFTLYCTGTPDGNRKYCPKCRKRKSRQANKLLASYMNIKHRAKGRGKIFKLTLKQFKTFCDENNYLELKGQGADDMSIDCIDPRKGYVEGNIQMLTIADNSKKGCKEPFKEPYVYNPGDPF